MNGIAFNLRKSFAKDILSENQDTPRIWVRRLKMQGRKNAASSALRSLNQGQEASLRRNIVGKLSQHCADRILKYTGYLRRSSLTDSQI